MQVLEQDVRSIMVVEDHEDMRANICNLLAYEGFSVRQAANGEAAVSAALEEPPDLILCDINLPAMDGYAVLREVRSSNALSAVPFILLSAASSVDKVRQGLLEGADDFVIKPFTSSHLLGSIRNRLRRARDFSGRRGQAAGEGSLAAEDRILSEDFLQGLRSGEVYPNYQGLFDRNGELRGAEVLLRWNHPTRGLVPPSVFIPSLERSGRIHQAGRFILERACGTAARGLPISVNVSPRQLDPDFVCFARKMAMEYDLPSGAIQLEVTESAFYAPGDELFRYLADLARHGFRIAMDDFGTGYSNYSRMKETPADCIKIDRSFVPDDLDDEIGVNLLGSMIRLVHALRRKVIVEGVERADQFELVRSFGADLAQGYHLHRPGPYTSLPLRTSADTAHGCYE